VAETSYASCGDLSLAYQVFGDGPVELVFVGPFVSHIELVWTLPEFKAFFDQLSTFCRVLLFDKAGVGLSDPVPKVRTLDDRAAEVEAVMDAAGLAPSPSPTAPTHRRGRRQSELPTEAVRRTLSTTSAISIGQTASVMALDAKQVWLFVAGAVGMPAGKDAYP
jgi:pimeloyl-ACP methyl ester carboxylesterase